MLDSLDLIKKPSHQALVDILNHNNQTMIQYSTVKFRDMSPVSGRKTQITIEALPYSGAKPPFIGNKTFTYHRLDLNEFLDPVLKRLKVNLPATTNEVINRIRSHYDMYVDNDDFVIENIPEGTTEYSLKAGSQSLRYINNVIVEILPEDIPLSDVITLNLLDGLDDPYIEVPLSDIYRVVICDGLTAENIGINISDFFLNTILNGYWTETSSGYVEHIRPIYSSNEMLKRLIDDSVMKPLLPNQYSVGNVVPLSTGNRNTQLVLNGNPDQNVIGNVTLHYNRYDIAYMVGEKYRIYDVDIENYDGGLLGYLEDVLGLVFTSSDFDIIQTTTYNYRITAKANSVVWFGESNVISVNTNRRNEIVDECINMVWPIAHWTEQKYHTVDNAFNTHWPIFNIEEERLCVDEGLNDLYPLLHNPDDLNRIDIALNINMPLYLTNQTLNAFDRAMNQKYPLDGIPRAFREGLDISLNLNWPI